MGAKYDAERFIDDLLEIFRTNLNTKIAEIQAEKAIFLGSKNFDLPTLEDNAWFDTLDVKTVNFDPFVYFGINDNALIEIESAEASDYTAFSTVILDYNGDDATMYKKMLRYIRALREIVSENFDTISEVSNLKVATINPTNFQDLDVDDDNMDNSMNKIGGITLQGAIS